MPSATSQRGTVVKVPPRRCADGIQALRTLFSHLWFDAEKCQPGLQAVRAYQRLWDEKRKVFLNEPYHNWASHAADALRMFALGYRAEQLQSPPQHHAIGTGNPLGGRAPAKTLAPPGRMG